MTFFTFIPLILSTILLLTACSNENKERGEQSNRIFNATGEYLYRLHDEFHYVASAPEKRFPEPYQWEKTQIGNFPKLTKEYFRCKGSHLNPVHTYQVNGELQRHFDCGGSEKHSLPLRNEKEFIYPVLIDILNYIQIKTGKRIVITSGYRCPEHNTYVDPSPENQHSKHMLGAAVSFYVQGLEDRPESIIKLVQNYYVDSTKFKGQKELEEFKRYEKGDTDVIVKPWFNKEVFIKLYGKKEGRDFDNRHPYPYIDIQVRFDSDLNEKVIFTWDKAYHNYLRK